MERKTAQQQPTMRKYYQLLLAVVAVTSLVCFLFYKHEYERLRKVMEVLDFFGSNTAPKSGLKNEPTPSWQKVSDEWYIYSAFWDEQVFAFGVGTTEKIRLDCYLVYEDKLEQGQVDYFPMAVLSTYKFSCGFSKPVKNIPQGVVFVPYMGDPLHYAPIPVTPVNMTSATSVCVLPFTSSSAIPTQRQILEFIAYNEVVAVASFIFYSSVLKTAADVTVVPWNYPNERNSTIERFLVTQDCLMRSGGLNVGVMNVDQIVVPHYHHTLEKLLVDNGDAQEYQFTSRKFCTEMPSRPDPTRVLILDKVKYAQEGTSSVRFYRRGSSRSVKTISATIASVHTYSECHKSADINSDMVMSKFADSIIEKLV